MVKFKTEQEVIEEKYELMSLFFTQHYSQLSILV